MIKTITSRRFYMFLCFLPQLSPLKEQRKRRKQEQRQQQRQQQLRRQQEQESRKGNE